MAYTEWEGEDRNPVWEKDKKGKVLEGVYTESRTVQTSNGENNIYTLETKDGEMDVWGDSLLNNFFGAMPSGIQVKITYQGKEKSKKGGREYHSYKFEYDKEQFETLKAEEELENL